MAYDSPNICATFIAGESLTAAQYKFMKLNGTDNTVVICAATTDIPIGVLQNNPASGGAANVCIFGLTKVQGDADLTAGNRVGTSADGQAAIYTVADTTKHLVGHVVMGNSAAAGLATILYLGSSTGNIT